MKTVDEEQIIEDRIKGPVFVEKGSLRVRDTIRGQVLEGKLSGSDDHGFIALLKSSYAVWRDPNLDLALQEYYDIYLC